MDTIYQNTFKMSACYYENTKQTKFTRRTVNIYTLIDIKMMVFYINYDNLTNIIKNILTEFCDAKVIGYEKTTNKYWCKMYENKFCSQHIELELLRHTNEITLVKIVPKIGTDLLIKNFVSNFEESIHLYITSSFIRGLLDSKMCL